MKPIIGITPSPQTDTLAHGTFRRYCLSAAYVDAVAAAGGIPIILPPQVGNAEALLAVVDGLLLSGGADVAPDRYGETQVHATTYGVDPARDQLELDLIDRALTTATPILGICRGIQVLNVALGGTLIQDIASEHPGAAEIGHRQHERGVDEWAVGHDVVATAADLLPMFNHGHLGVNSFHHQAIRDLAPLLHPVAFSPDGLIEAVVMAENPAVFAVQWHPELMFRHDSDHLRPFLHLVEQASARTLTAAAR